MRLRFDGWSCRESETEGCSCLEEQYSLQRDSEDGAPADGSPKWWHRVSAAAIAALRPLWTRALLPALFLIASPLVIVSVRILVRRRAFWLKGLQQAHCHAETVTPELLYRYRLPALVRGWEAGLLRFLRARLMRSADDKLVAAEHNEAVLAGAAAESLSRGLDTGAGAGGAGGKAGPDDSLLRRFQRRLDETGVPVVIVHGEQDSLVPIGNSCRLSAALRAPLVKLSDCGHTPAEEVPRCFVEVIARFVRQVREESRSAKVPAAAGT